MHHNQYNKDWNVSAEYSEGDIQRQSALYDTRFTFSVTATHLTKEKKKTLNKYEKSNILECLSCPFAGDKWLIFIFIVHLLHDKVTHHLRDLAFVFETVLSGLACPRCLINNIAD